MPDTISIRNMQIFASGISQPGPFGNFVVSNEMLDAIVRNFNTGVGREDGIPLKLGHTSTTFNRLVAEALGMPELFIHGDSADGPEDPQGRPRLGSVNALRREGGVLVADFDNVAPGLADILGQGKSYNAVSSEVEYTLDWWYDTPVDAVLSGVALLGSERPRVGYLDQSKMTVENSDHARRYRRMTVHNVFSPEAPVEQSISKAPLDLLKDIWYYISNTKPSVISPAEDEVETETETRSDEMDNDKLREALSLPKDASEADILAALESLKMNPASTEDETESDSVGEVEAAENQQDETSPISSMAVQHDPVINSLNNLTGMVRGLAQRLERVENHNSVLVADALDNEYINSCREFNALPGTPEDMGKKLADIERNSGRTTAQEVLETYRTANTALKQAGLISPVGVQHPGEAAAGDHPFLRKVKEYALANEIPEDRAFAKLSAENADGEFTQYRRFDLEARGKRQLNS